METEISRPIPGMEKTFSTMILPPRISAAVIPKNGNYWNQGISKHMTVHHLIFFPNLYCRQYAHNPAFFAR